jgi:hypothetical protein
MDHFFPLLLEVWQQASRNGGPLEIGTALGGVRRRRRRPKKGRPR